MAALLAAAVPSIVEAQAVPAPSASALGKARELMAVMNIGELTEKALDAQTGIMTRGLADRIAQSGIAPPELMNDPEFRQIMQRYFDRISVETTTKIKALLPQIVEQNTLIYARNFSATELAGLVTFYRSPTGQAFLAKTPALTAEMAAVSRDLTVGPTMDVVKGLVPQMMAELQAWGDKHKSPKGAKQ